MSDRDDLIRVVVATLLCITCIIATVVLLWHGGNTLFAALFGMAALAIADRM